MITQMNSRPGHDWRGRLPSSETKVLLDVFLAHTVAVGVGACASAWPRLAIFAFLVTSKICQSLQGFSSRAIVEAITEGGARTLLG